MHKLLFDNNISHRIVKKIEDIFPNSSHVMTENLDEATDHKVWMFARSHHFAIMTKDSDFNDIAIHRGIPPKIIWLKLGNCKIPEIENTIRVNEKEINKFLSNENEAILEI